MSNDRPDIEAMQKRLSAIECPLCRNTQFLIIPRAEKSFGEDIYKARCTQCAYTFQVSVLTASLKQIAPDVDQWLNELRCPSCHDHGAQPQFRCMPSVRECLYFVNCRACGHPYQERAPMEAFE